MGQCLQAFCLVALIPLVACNADADAQFTAFTAFSRSTVPPPTSDEAPIIGIIETEDKKSSEEPGEGEVFYIFYENEDLPQVT